MDVNKRKIPPNVSNELIEAIFKVYASSKEMFENNEKDIYSQIDVEAEFQKNDTDIKLSGLKNMVKETMINRLDSALSLFKLNISDKSDMYDEAISLLSRFNRITSTFQKGLIEFNLYDREIIKIENALLYMLNRLEIRDLNIK